MVYKLFDDESVRTVIGRRKPKTRIKLPQWHIQTESIFANFIVKTLKFLLFIYDIISWPIYFILQRPDQRAKDAQSIRSERVDINTWIRTDPSPNKSNYLLHCYRNGNNTTPASNQKITYKYMGSTLSEIFANSVDSFSGRHCLGYRAVVTCPVLSLNERGEHVMQDKSFRSDYTWYTYEQIGRRVQDLASGLYYHSIYPGSRSLFMASTCLEWFCASQACFQLASQIVIAPEVNDDNDNSLLRLIFQEVEIDVIFVSCDKLKKLCNLLDSLISSATSTGFHVKKVVIIDWQFAVDFNEPAFGQLRDAARDTIDHILSMGQVEEIGIENPIELRCTRALRDTTITDNEVEDLKEQSSEQLKSNLFSSNLSIIYHRQNKSDQNGCVQKNPFANAPLTSPIRRRSTACSSLNNGLRSSKSPELALAGSSLTVSEWRLSVKPSDICRRKLASRGSSPRLSLLDPIAYKLNDKTRVKPDDVAMIVYTHGQLGQIRALQLTHSYLARSNHYLFLDGVVTGDDIHCTTLALDNVIEFMTEMCIFSHGGSIGYSSNQLDTLFYDGKELFKRDRSDLEALNPSFLLVRPYILESLRTSVQNYLSFELNPMISFLLTNVVFDYKKYWARKHLSTPIIDKLFCSRPKRLFGSQIKYILCNGATDCSETKDFFAYMLNIPVIELYGPDEALVSMISVNDIWDYKRRRKTKNRRSNWTFYWWKLFLFGGCNYESIADELDEDEGEEKQHDFFKDMQLLPPKVNRNNTFRQNSSRNLLITSSILCPTLGARIRLDDWEDFRTSDLPYPRGRLVIGGDVVCKDYFKRADLTKKVFFSDSNQITWFRTNDIARVFPNGSFEIISAMSDMMKMSDGQFISLSQIEHILRNSQFVDNVCAICGEDRRFVIALVVPNLRRLALKSPGEADLKSVIGMEPEPEELIDIEFRREICNDRLLCEFVSEHLGQLISKAGLKNVSKRFMLVPEIWTPETELVTPAFEPKRSAIEKFYAADIQSIFKMEFSKNNKKRLSARISRRNRKFSR